MEKLIYKKWYNSRSSVEILLFMLPPLGLYALYRNRTIKSRTIRLLYGTIGFITSFILMMLVAKHL